MKLTKNIDLDFYDSLSYPEIITIVYNKLVAIKVMMSSSLCTIIVNLKLFGGGGDGWLGRWGEVEHHPVTTLAYIFEFTVIFYTAISMHI